MTASLGFPQGRGFVHDRNMGFLEKIEVVLERMKWTQGRLEREAFLATNRISRWKAGVGKGPSVDEGMRISHVLGVPLDLLADDTKELPAPDHPMIRHDPILGEMRRRTLELAESIGWDRAARIMDIAVLIGPEEAMRRLANAPEKPDHGRKPTQFGREVPEPEPRPIKKRRV